MGLEGGGTEEEEKKEKEEEKISHMCESIDHRPLWGRCPKTKTGFAPYEFLILDDHRVIVVSTLVAKYFNEESTIRLGIH